jgi:hypothetical protein
MTDVFHTLENLVDQLTDAGWRDRNGHRIEMNSAFREATAMVDSRRPDERPQFAADRETTSRH